jgi:hypothetical protein
MDVAMLDASVAACAVETIVRSRSESPQNDTRLIEAYLSDLLPQNRREANILLLVAKADVLSRVFGVADLSRISPLVLDSAIARTIAGFGMEKRLAEWGVLVWMQGLAKARGQDESQIVSRLSHIGTSIAPVRRRKWHFPLILFLAVALAITFTQGIVRSNMRVPNDVNPQKEGTTSVPAASALSAWLDTGSRGAVELSVSANWVGHGTIGSDYSISLDVLKLRISLVNHSRRPLDISPAAKSIVVLSSLAPGSAFSPDAAHQPVEVVYSRDEMAVFGYPIAAGSWTLTNDGSPLSFEWRGNQIMPGESFSGSKDDNGAMFVLPLTAPDSSDITLAQANVIGLACLDVNGGLLGFLSSADWGTSTREAFVSAPN